MRRKGHIVNRFRKKLPTLGDEPLLFADNLPRYDVSRNADTFIKLVQMNPYNKIILDRMHMLDAEDCWLVSGCLFQTVWNVMEGKAPAQDILDYDLIYFDPDQSREAEEAKGIKMRAVFDDLDVKVDMKNQARVHLWYQSKFNQGYPELSDACESLKYYPSKVQAIALQSRGGGRVSYDAPFGFEHMLRMAVRPNPALNLSDIYADKTKRWKEKWPSITVADWS